MLELQTQRGLLWQLSSLTPRLYMHSDSETPQPSVPELFVNGGVLSGVVEIICDVMGSGMVRLLAAGPSAGAVGFVAEACTLNSAGQYIHK